MVKIFGRDDSLRALANAAEAARSGRGRLVMVRADPGLGVTTLLNAHVNAVRDAGLSAFRIPVLPPEGRTSLSNGGLPEWPEPAVIVIDDLHRADDATLLALHELVEGLPERALLVIAGRHRGVAPARFAQLDSLAEVHDLSALDGAAVRSMLTELSGAEPSEASLRRAEGAAGNPWLLARLDSPDRASLVTQWATERAGGDSALLRFLALLDEPAAIDDLAAVAGMSAFDALAGVSRLATLGLVEERDGQVWLRHALVRDDVAASSAGLRGTVARIFAERGAPAAVVADQLVHAPVDSWDGWIDWLAAHVDQLSAWPIPAGVELLTRAVSWLSIGDPRLHPMRVALAEAQLFAGSVDSARHTATITLAARVDPALRLRLRGVLAMSYVVRFDFERALEVLAPERENGALPGRFALTEALARLLIGDLDETNRLIEQAAPEAEGNPAVEVYLLNVRSILRLVSRDLSGAIELLDRAAALHEITMTDRGQWAFTHLLRAVTQDLRHDPTALRTVEKIRPEITEVGTGLRAWFHTVAALSAFNNGRWDQSLTEISIAMEMPEQYGMARPLHALAALILLRRGDIPAASVHIELAEQSTAHAIALFYEQLTVIVSAWVADATGDTDRALELVRGVADGGVGVHHGHAVAAVGAHLVSIAVRGGDRELASRLVDELHRWNSGDTAGEHGVVEYAQALLDGDVDGLLAAAKLFADTGIPGAGARVAEEAATLLASSGKSEEAKALLREAIDKYTTLSATWDVDRADAAFRQLGARRGATGKRGRPKHGWDSLTDAEYRVAELVAQGHTNKQIAERLIVSVRTVHSHVSRILSKLDCASRVQVAVSFQERD